MAMDPRDFGARLRDARKDAGLTQSQLAAKVGVSQSYVSQLERAPSDEGSHPITEPGAYVVRAMEDALDVYPGYLTESEDARRERDCLLATMRERYGEVLKLTEAERLFMERKVAFLLPGNDPGLSYWMVLLEHVRATMSSLT